MHTVPGPKDSSESPRTSPGPAHDFLTIDQTAEYLQVSRSTVTRWLGKRALPYIQLPSGRIRFSRRDLDAWIDSRRRSARR